MFTNLVTESKLKKNFCYECKKHEIGFLFFMYLTENADSQNQFYFVSSKESNLRVRKLSKKESEKVRYMREYIGTIFNIKIN